MLERKYGTTRQYNSTNGVRLASGAASSAATALPTMGETREVRVHASEALWIRFGDSGVAATLGATSIPFNAGSVEVVEVPGSATHFAVIRDSADGFVTLTPVA
ncbi:MAG: hypothetical protein V4696_07500 [Pseudomonadota bacterium]